MRKVIVKEIQLVMIHVVLNNKAKVQKVKCVSNVEEVDLISEKNATLNQ
jgi:hypothetical protein